ncbi:low molecular weight protein-tyrosine-phosphatase [Roseinatronobacter alkalisoli]|uniref:protein-tyrosine-phosphatase n=1 Tax=Roseinatronobacter alkalisoli TaxID=3028235 RepID=A0ABT5TA47_9RHOB|nr:low molecular weight protein-tyrosine-phosphatase [Roseinatronobacter sp. HJB301]MDD7971992.1 low molecular weight phosphotyrosine protein phosphatase [Roseinatronobacter sp. HJB301]
MFPSVLVVCVGNICRSPVGERLLATKLAQHGSTINVSSAGIAALEGHAADEDAATVAKAHGVSLDGHIARQFSRTLGAEHALILVMESGHKREIIKSAPDLSGRVMLFDHWIGGKGIADPYCHSIQFHQEVFAQIEAAAAAWTEKLVK